MKLDGLSHPKTKELAYTLEVPLPHAIGLLELLWAFVGQQTPQGNVGKWSNAVIAGEAGWIGCPDTFVDALVSVGYLDRHDDHRLLVHDWADHCPNWVHAKLRKTGREIIRPDLSSDLSADLRGRYKPSQAKPSQTNTSGDADAPPDSQLAVVESVIDLPTNKHDTEGEVFPVTESLVTEFRQTYPAVDIDQALRSMRAWLLANRAKRKTRRGMERFVNAWLAREQDKGGSKPVSTTRSRAIADDLTDTSWAH